MISKYSRKNDLISHILHQKDDILNQTISVSGWVRTCRTSEKGFGFCLLNDGSCGKGIQLILSSEYLDDDKLEFWLSFSNYTSDNYGVALWEWAIMIKNVGV